MKNTNKKGFTIVELVIVIAVIAILAAVLIPTFVGLVNKANVASDTALIKNLNTALAADTDGCKTMHEALEAAAAYGYDVAKINAKGSNNEILWDSKNNVFCYFNSEKNSVEYIPDSVSGDKATGAELWVISEEVSTTYSTYYVGGENIDSETTTGICVATNGTNLTINAPNANVTHYGDVADLTITAVASNSYHEFGRVTGLATVAAGRVVVEDGGSIGTVVVTNTGVKLEGNFGMVMGTNEVLTDLGDIDGTKVEVTEDALTSVSTAVVIVDGTFYDDFATALADAADNKTVVLVRDVEYAANSLVTVTEEQVVTIDLNGHVIAVTAGEDERSAVITNKGNLTIKDSVGGGKITTNALNPDMKPIPGFASNTISNNGILTLESGTIENTTNAGAAYPVDCYPGSTFTMNGGKLVAARCALRMFCNSDKLATTVVINDGVIEGGNRGIWIQLPGSSANSQKIANLTINGGTVTGKNTEDCALYSYSYGDSFAKTNVTITGGTFNGTVAFGGGYKGDTETVSITGGTFNGNLGRYLENDGWEDIAKP